MAFCEAQVLACSNPSGHDSLADREIKGEELRSTAPQNLLEAFNRVLNDPLWLHPDEGDQLPLSVFEPFYRKERVAGRDIFHCILLDQEDLQSPCRTRTTQSTHAKNHAKVHFDYRVYGCIEW